jgi:hypothetical protein
MGADYYSTLGVPGSASEDDLKKAFKKLAVKWHPGEHGQQQATLPQVLGHNGWCADVDQAFMHPAHNSKPHMCITLTTLFWHPALRHCTHRQEPKQQGVC